MDLKMVCGWKWLNISAIQQKQQYLRCIKMESNKVRLKI
ncbi:unnamed protein product [Paramecium sonneborni]|uniref:Uncharacterized protein n=1 Tax=Paramecium sonneborni TaxID=65129 RepID=A0A8S1PX36_9CILI|nr:unnamed protein product [Paramecium sonneborni]